MGNSLKRLSHAISKTCAVCDRRETNPICCSPEALPIIENAKLEGLYRAGSVIYNAGTEPQGIYTVSRGLIKLEKNSESGASHTMNFIGTGGIFGYRSLLSHQNHENSAIAVEDSEICFIPKVEVLALFKKDPEIAVRLILQISKDLQQSENKWIDQVDKGAPERIADSLLFLFEHYGPQKWTRRDIAQWAGTTPETVIRTLAQFEKEGLIDQTDGRSIKILKKEALREKSQFKF